MRIAVTGASGFVGRLLVPLLAERGADLVLAGRDVARLHSLFPGHECVDHGALEAALKGCDMLVHLAVRNNDRAGSLDDFTSVNVDFLLQTAQMARRAGVTTFVNLTSLHALVPDVQGAGSRSHYARSKREGERALAALDGLNVVTFRLPAVYGRTDGGLCLAGRLKPLVHLPAWMRPVPFRLAGAFRPMLDVAKLADALVAARSAGGERILSDRQIGNPVYFLFRFAVDAGFVLVVAGLLWWLLGLVWLAVRLTSGGPGILRQRRVGRQGRVFTCFKFRTMFAETRVAATHEVGQASVTPVGRFLRATKIDELPQFWNILVGDMSLLGPRPSLDVQEELIQLRQQAGVLDVRPGITGWSQVNGMDMRDPAELARMDADYLAMRTIPLEIRVLLRTLFGRGGGDNVRREGSAERSGN